MLPEHSGEQAPPSPVSEAQLVKDAATAYRAGDKPRARALLAQAVRINPNNELAWLWSASVASSQAEAVRGLEQALRLNPDNQKAKFWMAKLAKQAGQQSAAKSEPSPAAKAPGTVAKAPQSPAPKPPATARALESESPKAQPNVQSKSAADNDGRISLGQQAAAAAKSDAAPTNLAAASQPIGSQPAATEPTEKFAPPPALSRQSPLRATLLGLGEVTAYKSPEDAEAPAQSHSGVCPVCGEQAVASEPCGECGCLSDLASPDDISKSSSCRRDIVRKALDRLTADLEQRPSSEINVALAVAHLNLKDSEAAVKCLKEACRLNPTDGSLTRNLKKLTSRRLILVVDDSQTVVRSVQFALETACFRVRPAHDGLQALAKLDQEIPDLILLDVTMPRMDGYQVCKVIKGNDSTRHVPVIMLSGKDGFFNKVKGRMAGASEYITKPFDTHSLVETVRERIPS